MLPNHGTNPARHKTVLWPRLLFIFYVPEVPNINNVAETSGRRGRHWAGKKLGRQIFGADGGALAADDGKLDGAPELTHVAGPGVGGQLSHRLVARLDNPFTGASAAQLQERGHEQGNILTPLAKRRDFDPGHAYAVEQIGAEIPLLHLLAQIAVCGRQHAHVDFSRLRFAEPGDFSFLQDSEEVRLHVQGNVSNLVEKERPFLGGFEHSLVIGNRSCERPPPMSEELARQQRIREAGAVHGEERPLRPGARFVNGACHELLARSRLTFHQYGRVHGGHVPYELVEGAHGVDLADQVMKLASFAELAPQGLNLRDVVEEEDLLIGIARVILDIDLDRLTSSACVHRQSRWAPLCAFELDQPLELGFLIRIERTHLLPWSSLKLRMRFPGDTLAFPVDEGDIAPLVGEDDAKPHLTEDGEHVVMASPD